MNFGSRGMGWRLRALVGAALLGCVCIVMLARWLADAPHVDATWRTDAQGRLDIATTGSAALKPSIGRSLVAISAGGRSVAVTDALSLQRSPRWWVHDAERQRQQARHEQLGQVLANDTVTLHFADGSRVTVPLAPRGVASLGALFWMLGALALLLYLVAMVVLAAKPSGRNALFALMALCQAGNLVCIGIESTVWLALPAPLPWLDMPLRMGFDLVTVTAIVHASSLHPTRLRSANGIGVAAWLATAALLFAANAGWLSHLWWWAQGSVIVLGLAALAVLSASYRTVPHPVALVLRRFGVATLAIWVLVTVAVSMASPMSALQHQIAQVGSVVWCVFLASLLALVPFLSKSQQVMREFALLAAVSTVATSLDLVFVALFALGPFASLTLSLFLSIGVYIGARQWLLNQLLGSSVLTTERMFEHLYRIAREVEARPDRAPALLTLLLHELFEPMRIELVDKPCVAARVVGDGAAMLMPLPVLPASTSGLLRETPATAATAILLRFAHRGRRLFTSEDARLADRIVEQLRRAVAFDKAVEQGRTEERARLAQDLHDDIGARLLTLMYKAPTPEMEEYLRHTLQDLKTLTRGLAASQHRLSHAAAEWKADLSQRLAAADVDLRWTFDTDDDVMLNVVQWSALTRVLRELASNAIAHAGARRLDITIHLHAGALDLSARDDGSGRNPQAWAHGLGLGGIRKRVKQLGGEVEWQEVQPAGIVCRVHFGNFASRA